MYLCYIVTHKRKLFNLPIYKSLFVFILVNFISIYNAPNPNVVFKECILLLSNFLLFFMVVQLLIDELIFKKSLRLLLFVGIIEGCYGVYQFVIGILQYYYNINLPYFLNIRISQMGSELLRPFGTFKETGWLSVVMMFYFILFLFLYSDPNTKKSKFYKIGILTTVVVMLACLSRSAYIGLLGGFLLGITYFPNSFKYVSKKSIFKASILIIIIVSCLIILISGLSENLLNRINYTKSYSSEPRLIQINHSLNLFKKHPIIGTGPGSFSELGVFGSPSIDSEYEYWNLYQSTTGLKPWNISIIGGLLVDTGILGIIVFIWFIISYVKYTYGSIKKIEDPYFKNISSGLFIGILCLLMSYIFSSGFWIPFTWVFLAFSVAATRLGLISKEIKIINKIKPNFITINYK